MVIMVIGVAQHMADGVGKNGSCSNSPEILSYVFHPFILISLYLTPPTTTFFHYHHNREQLRRCFGIKLTPQEFGALLNYFDREHNGSIDCVEFLVSFFRTG